LNEVAAARRPARPARADVRRAQVSVGLLFVVFGVMDAAWTSRIPLIRERLALSDLELSAALTGPAAGLMVAALLTPRLVRRTSGPWVARGAALGASVLVVAPALARHASTLFLALALWGACLGALDIAMNDQGAALERITGRSLMSGLHASYSGAVLLFAPIGSLAATLEIEPLAHFAFAGVIGVVLVAFGMGALVADPREDATSAGSRTGARQGKLGTIIPLVACVGLLCEGAVLNWSGVLLHHEDGASLAVAPLALTGFSVGMVLGRLAGDRLIDRHGHGPVATLAAVLAGSGLAVAAAVTVPATAIAGFAVMGAGLSVLVPIAFAVAARTPGISPVRAIARLTTAGYAALFVGPPVVGLVATALGLRAALMGLAVTLLGLAALTHRSFGR
jgi:fucose permease